MRFTLVTIVVLAIMLVIGNSVIGNNLYTGSESYVYHPNGTKETLTSGWGFGVGLGWDLNAPLKTPLEPQEDSTVSQGSNGHAGKAFIDMLSECTDDEIAEMYAVQRLSSYPLMTMADALTVMMKERKFAVKITIDILREK